MEYSVKTMPSPVGALQLVATDQGLAAILWEDDAPNRVRLGTLQEAPEHPVLCAAERQLAAYFAGKLQAFSVPLHFHGTEFQKRVWSALLTIPFGETRSYGEIARQIGRPNASRAVGAANGKNPISIIAPCHRVIGANGKLTGFAGGLAAKEFLLNLESRNDPMGEQRAGLRLVALHFVPVVQRDNRLLPNQCQVAQVGDDGAEACIQGTLHA